MRLLLFTFLLGFLSCQSNTTTVSTASTFNAFFDLKKFFNQEISQLSNVKQFKKTISINGIEESQELTGLNLEEELAIFINSDINRPAWSDKYRVDSIFNEKKELVQLEYHSLDKKLKTQKLNVRYQDNSVISIEIIKNLDNAVAKSNQVLTYFAQKGYRIHSRQALSFSETKELHIEVVYLLD